MTCQKVKKKNKITTLDILLGCTLQRIKKSHADLGTTDLLQKVVRPLKKTTLPRYSTRKATSFEMDTAGKYDRQRKPNYERLISQNSTLLYQQNNQNLGDQGIFKIRNMGQFKKTTLPRYSTRKATSFFKWILQVNTTDKENRIMKD